MSKRTVCIGIETPDSDWGFLDSIYELEELAGTAGLAIIDQITQNREKPNQQS